MNTLTHERFNFVNELVQCDIGAGADVDDRAINNFRGRGTVEPRIYRQYKTKSRDCLPSPKRTSEPPLEACLRNRGITEHVRRGKCCTGQIGVENSQDNRFYFPKCADGLPSSSAASLLTA